jgi:hypothetical protein
MLMRGLDAYEVVEHMFDNDLPTANERLTLAAARRNDPFMDRERAKRASTPVLPPQLVQRRAQLLRSFAISASILADYNKAAERLSCPRATLEDVLQWYDAAAGSTSRGGSVASPA